MGLRPDRGLREDQRRVLDMSLAAAVVGKTLVFKLGGSVGREDTLPEDAQQLQDAGARVVLVHGGGPLITRWLDRIGKETRFVGGLRRIADRGRLDRRGVARAVRLDRRDTDLHPHHLGRAGAELAGFGDLRCEAGVPEGRRGSSPSGKRAAGTCRR